MISIPQPGLLGWALECVVRRYRLSSTISGHLQPRFENLRTHQISTVVIFFYLFNYTLAISFVARLSFLPHPLLLCMRRLRSAGNPRHPAAPSTRRSLPGRPFSSASGLRLCKIECIVQDGITKLITSCSTDLSAVHPVALLLPCRTV